MAGKKEARQIKYLNMGYSDFVRDLQNFRKVFFPEVSKDFNPASSGQAMTEEAAFIGDVLSHYLEDRFRNSNMVTAQDVEQIYNLSEFLGYKPSGPAAARGPTNFYIEVPSVTGSSGEWIPDMRYAFAFKNVQLENNNGIIFEALEDIDFSSINPSSSLEAKVSETTTDGIPTKYVLKTVADVIAGRSVTKDVSAGSYERFKQVEFPEANVLSIESVTDSEGNKWYEVDHLAQEVIFEGIENTGNDSEHVPYYLKLKAVPRRFVTKTNPKTGKTTLFFGAGKATDVGDSFVPNPSDIALDLKGRLEFSSPAIDPQNFLKTKTLGLSPYDTTLTIKARVGGGKITNTSRNNLRAIISKTVDFPSSGLNSDSVSNTINSFATNNISPITGGDEAERPEDIKQFSSANFASQRRLTTREDYIFRCLSLPSYFGKIFRCHAALNCDPQGGVKIYVIARNELDQLITPTEGLKKNLKNYLSLFSRLGQGIDILEGRIINMAIEYNIIVAPGFNKTETKLKTLLEVKKYFNVENWQLNQPIIIDEIRCLIKDVEGVLSVPDIVIKNKNNQVDGSSYSEELFSPTANTKNGIIFCPQNAIFEVKYPDGADIKVGAL